MMVRPESADAEIAREIAAAAGRLLLELRERSGLRGKELGDRADGEANALILARLRQLRPDDAVLSEEAPDDPARLEQQRVWIIDPLDGTREYREGRDDWAVHIGLAIDGVPAIGAVAIPVRGEVFVSGDRPGPPPLRAAPLLVTSRSRRCDEAGRIADALGARRVEMGSAGAKAMAVMRGEADLYVHSGGHHQWDSCAPVAVALGAGLHASRLDGTLLAYNRAETLIADLIICRAELADAALAALRING